MGPEPGREDLVRMLAVLAYALCRGNFMAPREEADAQARQAAEDTARFARENLPS